MLSLTHVVAVHASLPQPKPAPPPKAVPSYCFEAPPSTSHDFSLEEALLTAFPLFDKEDTFDDESHPIWHLPPIH